MSKVLVISGHPDLQKSFTNTVILEELNSSLSDVEIRRLDALYPDFKIDVAAEQAALIKADVVVLQFPFYWYSVPGLLKQWIDDVFSYNFAYGAEGDKLKNKDLILSFTVGGPTESYDPLGYNHFTIEEMVKPLQQTVYLTGMNYREPVYTHSMVYIPGVYNELEDVQGRAKEHATRLIGEIENLTNSAEVRIQKFVTEWFEQFDQLPQESEFFTNSLAEDINWVMPEGAFSGHEGFRSWYALARESFKPGCDHDVEQLEIKATENGFQADLRIRLRAETYEASAFKGESLNLLVNEVWQISLNDQGKVILHDYRVTPVATS